MLRRMLATVTVLGALVGVAPAVAAASGGTVSATGTGQTRVQPADRNSDASIAAAVDAARQASIKGALDQAHEYALQYAAAAGLTLGAVQSVSDNSNNGNYYGGGPFGFYGPFGPNRYCGTVVQRHVTRTHGHRVVHTKKVHRCFVPPFAFVTLSVTYAAS